MIDTHVHLLEPGRFAYEWNPATGIAFDPEQRVALYFGIPFIAWCYFVYWVTRNS